MSKEIPTSLYFTPASLHCAEDLCFGLLALVSLSAVTLAFSETEHGAFSGSPSMAGWTAVFVQRNSNLVARGSE